MLLNSPIIAVILVIALAVMLIAVKLVLMRLLRGKQEVDLDITEAKPPHHSEETT